MRFGHVKDAITLLIIFIVTHLGHSLLESSLELTLGFAVEGREITINFSLVMNLVVLVVI
jgi:hypothetical protein